MIKKIVAVLGSMALMFAAGAFAQSTQNTQGAPDAVVKSMVDEVLSVIKTNKYRRLLSEVVDKKVLPNFDFQAMTCMAVGRAWRDASPAQQQAGKRISRAAGHHLQSGAEPI